MIQNIITAMKYKLQHVFGFEVFHLEIFGNIVHPWIQASWLQVLTVKQLQPNQNSVLHELMLFSAHSNTGIREEGVNKDFNI